MGSDSDSRPSERLAQEHSLPTHDRHATAGQTETQLVASSLHALPLSTQHNTGAFFANHATFSDPFQAMSGAPPAFHVRQPSVAGLSIYTGAEHVASSDGHAVSLLASQHGRDNEPQPRTSSHLARPPMTTSRSFDSSSNILSPPSSVSSPMLAGLTDVTPLPSPIAPIHSPDLWKRVTERASRSRGNSAASIARDEALLGPSALSHSPSRVPSRKKKTYRGILAAPGGSTQDEIDTEHSRNRSVSEYTPEVLQNIRPRNVTLPGADAVAQANASRPASSSAVNPPQFHREQDFARRQNKSDVSTLHDAIKTIPSPPPSTKGAADREESDELRDQVGSLLVVVGEDHTMTDYKPIRRLGTGSFSQVILAAAKTPLEAPGVVAIKIVRHDPSARDDERMETSIKREIEMLQKVSHPSLPHMLGFEDTPMRALIVLDYCAGGDLFDVATQRRDLLSPTTIQRIFAEIVGAVSYLHELNIVHRDIKLENILCNISVAALENIADPRTYPEAIMTLTDLGLSRHFDPTAPLLSHPCGSTDYAAPELLLGQQYDGRATDAWALGILLYALLEGRLPFDPLPGKRNTGSVKHRIARCDWLWCAYGDQYGDWVEDKGHGLEGARQVTEGLLKKVGRGRWSLGKAGEHEWVRTGIQLGEGDRLRRASPAADAS